jgi:Zn-dependent protease with chaperone function
MTQYEYSFTWSIQQQVRAQRAVTRHLKGYLWLKALPFVMPAIITISLVLTLGLGGEHRFIGLINSLPYLLILVLLTTYLIWWAPRLAARQVQKQDPSVRGEIKHLTSDQGFSIRTVAAKIDLNWDHMAQVVETPEFLLYYYRPTGAYWTPKTAIPTADLPGLRATIRANLGDRARLADHDLSNRGHR